MKPIEEILTSDFNYDLPTEKIALHPAESRDNSKLLVYKNGVISDSTFNQIINEIPVQTNLFLNNAKVIPARLLLTGKTGAVIELFLLEPVNSDYQIALQSQNLCRWKCLVGNKRKWKTTEELQINTGKETLYFSLTDEIETSVRIRWESNRVFAEILESAGQMPLPPYIKRETELQDKLRYQTIYAGNSGAVAAPTAGLHFTEDVMSSLKNKGIQFAYATLHVGAGTFLPVTSSTAIDHKMHSERMEVSRDFIAGLLKKNTAICVGTTSVRIAESLYYIGCRLYEKNNNAFEIEKLEPYKGKDTLSGAEALQEVLYYMEKNNLDVIKAKTSIMIIPGYTFKYCDGLITNFHQPGSTLMMLIAAFTGDDWKKIYRHALDNNYRFLSYGDSNLLWKVYPKR